MTTGPIRVLLADDHLVVRRGLATLLLAFPDLQLVGVVNWGNGCYRPDSAGIYLRIDNEHFRDWIERAMAADPAIDELR